MDSPLRLIHKKEQELAERADEAKREAEAVLSRAHERARFIKETADREASEAAKAYFEREMLRAENEAMEIRTAGQQRARQLRESGRTRLRLAAQAIIDFVLPR